MRDSMPKELTFALVFFTAQVNLASIDLGLRNPPKVEYIGTQEMFREYRATDYMTGAFVKPCPRPGEWDGMTECRPTIIVPQLTLEGFASTHKRYKGRTERWLRCYARHETAHVRLGHIYGIRSAWELREQHRLVAALMLEVWDEDSRCTW
jgi:hypothetical protein